MGAANDKKWYSATNLFIISCIIIYILDKYIIIPDEMFFEDSGLFSEIIGLCGGSVFELFAYYPGCLADGEWWRIFTFLLIHIFLPHLTVNMIALYIAGNVIEQDRGKLYTIISFIFIGIASLFITEMLYTSDTPSITGGTSGAIFGFIGIVFIFSLKEKNYRKNKFSKLSRIFLAFYGVFFTYFMGTWTMIVHNAGFLLGLFWGIVTKKYQSKVHGF